MSEFLEPNPEEETLDDEELAYFIRQNKIQPEDIENVRNFSRFPKKLILEFHNYINTHASSEYMTDLMSKQIEQLGENQVERREFMQELLGFIEKYGHIAGYSLIRYLEEN